MGKKTKGKSVGPRHLGDRVKLLMAMLYKKGRIYIRLVDETLFIWDAVYKGEIFSHYIVDTLKKGRKTLTKKQVGIAVQMCYAGAATTIDMQMGVKLDKKTMENVERFESSREQFRKSLN